MTVATERPNILIIMADQLREPTAYDTEEIRRFRSERLTAETTLRNSGVTFGHHYAMSAACTPSRTSILTGQYPSLHGVTQTDGLAKDADSKDMFWLASDTVPTLGDWFRAGGYRTFYKGKWHISYAHLDAPDGNGYLQTMNADGSPIPENIAAYLEADLLDGYGFSEWVGPEPHGLGYNNTGTAKDPFTANETIDLLETLGQGWEQAAVAYGVLVPQPARRRSFRHFRSSAGASLRDRLDTACHQFADPRRGSFHQALLPAELCRCVGQDTGAAALD